jgi:hypothetical protein
MCIDCNLPRLVPPKLGVFVTTTTSASAKPVVSSFAPNDERSRIIHFVFDFLNTRQFVPVDTESYGKDLFELMNRSAPLYYACVALFAASQSYIRDESQKRRMITNEICPKAYIRSMELLRNKLPNQQSSVQLSTEEHSGLSWATFILSLVEVGLSITQLGNVYKII